MRWRDISLVHDRLAFAVTFDIDLPVKLLDIPALVELVGIHELDVI